MRNTSYFDQPLLVPMGFGDVRPTLPQSGHLPHLRQVSTVTATFAIALVPQSESRRPTTGKVPAQGTDIL